MSPDTPVPTDMEPGRGETLDTLFGDRLRLLQHRDGYRFSMDAVLLARFCAPAQGDRVVDLGTGCGVIALILAMDPAPREIVAIELQPGLADLAQRNVRLNRREDRITVVTGDVARISETFPPESFDLAVCNPPFGRPRTGRTNPQEEKALARHELLASLGDFVRAASFLVRFSGRLALVYKAEGLAYALRCLEEQGFAPKRMRMVHGRWDAPAKMVLLAAVKGGGPELKVDPPLILYNPDGSYTHDLESLYSP